MAGDPKRQKAEKYKDWLTPPQAVKALEAVYTGFSARSDLFARLQGGVIVAYALRVFEHPGDDEIDHVEIPRGEWLNVDLVQLAKDHFWETGSFTILESHSITGTVVKRTKFIGTRLDPEGVTAILDAHKVSLVPLATKPPEIAMEPSKIDRRGRPRKAGWDDLWVEMCRQILDDELMPNIQADVERAMLTWAEHHNIDIGETSVKEPAAKLFAVLHRKVRN